MTRQTKAAIEISFHLTPSSSGVSTGRGLKKWILVVLLVRYQHSSTELRCAEQVGNYLLGFHKNE